MGRKNKKEYNKTASAVTYSCNLGFCFFWIKEFKQALCFFIKNRGELFLKTLVIFFICLWVAVVSKKIVDYSSFKNSIIEQPFNDQLGTLFAYIIPLGELGVAILFLFRKTTQVAFASSLGLLSIYSGYIILVLKRTWGFIPCACTLQFNTDWVGHLWINGSIASLAIGALVYIFYIKRRKKISALVATSELEP